MKPPEKKWPHQFKPTVAQAKQPVPAPARRLPPAPPIYAPQTTPRVLQRKVANASQRPVPVPRVLRTNSANPPNVQQRKVSVVQHKSSVLQPKFWTYNEQKRDWDAGADTADARQYRVPDPDSPKIKPYLSPGDVFDDVKGTLRSKKAGELLTPNKLSIGPVGPEKVDEVPWRIARAAMAAAPPVKKPEAKIKKKPKVEKIEVWLTDETGKPICRQPFEALGSAVQFHAEQLALDKAKADGIIYLEQNAWPCNLCIAHFKTRSDISTRTVIITVNADKGTYSVHHKHKGKSLEAETTGQMIIINNGIRYKNIKRTK